MSKPGTSKLAAEGRRVLVRLGLKRRPTGVPLSAVLAGLVLAAGVVFAVVPLARKALARLTLRAKQRSDEASVENGTRANGTLSEAEAARRANEGRETDELARAENEGMHAGRS